MPTKIETLLREHRILTAFAAGRTSAQIAADEKITPAYVRRILQRYGRGSHHVLSRLSPAVAERLNDAHWLAAEYATKNVPQIARELGAPASQVIAALKRAGIPRRGLRDSKRITLGEKWMPDREEQVVALYRAGMSGRAIAGELGVSHTLVYNYLAQRGLTRSPREARLLSLSQQRDANQT